ncbi:MAG: ubiquinol oxidase subunit II [Salipiger thiooxidans]|uniref:ubiquinol oxidase subunit II n=1 Tax=Salipiger thiooxidans TaxID=282683 RepID=UPI001A8EA205|nr:ubiquinol oxidase subunit II [Salipiger thiooxidans]MBN8186351.1 ubiquinol oxidase subunit II [Salipiger thiooxidans]MBR9836610.1 ubiquinol oxidase subunit II [Paracoccaceae bacterium]
MPHHLRSGLSTSPPCRQGVGHRRGRQLFTIRKPLLAAAGALLLTGCQYNVLSPQGWVGEQQRDLLIISTLLMLIVIVPVLFMSVYFPLKYRADRENTSDYDPEFEHSNKLEAVVWGVPILIIVALGYYTAVYTHRLDPYRPLDYLDAGEPIEVQAVSLDWKWLFIYPELGVASVNELAIPAGRPVNFSLTSSTVMNTLSIPALGGMVYSMAGMETKLHLIADSEGTYEGRSAHYSGPGFAGMVFETMSMNEDEFNGWVENLRAEGQPLTADSYLALEAPTMNDPVSYYSSVEDGLFDRIVGLCVAEGKVCMSDMMMSDMHGGGGLAGIADGAAYSHDRERAIDGFGRSIDLPAVEWHGGHGEDAGEEGHDGHEAHDMQDDAGHGSHEDARLTAPATLPHAHGAAEEKDMN